MFLFLFILNISGCREMAYDCFVIHFIQVLFNYAFFFLNVSYLQAYLSLPEGTASVIGLIAMMTDHYNVLVLSKFRFLISFIICSEIVVYSCSNASFSLWWDRGPAGLSELKTVTVVEVRKT